MVQKDGLRVTVSPSASAFFAGELFTATITFTNAHPPPAPTPHAGAFASQQHYPHTAGTGTPRDWRNVSPAYSRSRPPSASHLGLPDYATQHLDTDEIPASPSLRSTSGNQLSSLASASTSHLPSPTAQRPAFNSTYSGSALPTPQSASFAVPPTLQSRSASGSGAPAQPSLPTRKGLIGKPIPQEPPKPPGGGLYAGGPRRPGGAAALLRGHSRAQSMAVSSPDLLARGGEDSGMRHASAPLQGRGHAKGRFGGSVAVQPAPMNGSAEVPSPYSSPARRLPAPIEEDDSPTTEAQPDFPDDAAFPPSSSSSAPAPPYFPRRPTFGHQRTSSNYPYGHNPRASLSTLTLASDDSDYDEPSNTSGSGFYGIGRNDTMDSVVEGDYHRAAKSAGPLFNRFSSAPVPAPYPSQPSHDRHRSISHANGSTDSSPLHPPNTLSLLWAFAHLEGAFEVDESLIKPAEFIEVKRLIAGAGIGGGTLEEKRDGSGWGGWLWGKRPPPQEDTHGAASLEERRDRAIKERAVPTFSCPPSILGVDLVLEPGQSKSFTFTLRIPADLPPSFRGKAIKFNYHLVVGTNRSALGPAPQASHILGYKRETVSRVMRVPVRVYNHVGVTGARPFYDLTNPIIFQRDEATTVDTENPKVPVRKTRRPDTGKQEFEAYAANLLDSVVANSPELIQNASLSPTLDPARSPTMMEAGPQLRPEMSSRAGGGAAPPVGGTGGGGGVEFGMDMEEGSGCKAAVEIVSRNSQKVSYDINKDGYQVASLTLVKSAYRLGETVNGSVVINSGEGRVLRVSARLETHELVETSISTMAAPRMRQMTRRLHSEHHEMTLDAARVGFALAIPSGATPDFGTSGVKLQWSVRLSFLIIPPSPEAGSAPAAPPPRRAGIGPFSRGAPPPAPLPPPSQNGAGGRHHGRSKSFAYGFEPAVPLTLPPPPSIAPSGAAHLMPLLPRAGDPSPVPHISYRAVPDLGFVPVPFSSAVPEPPPAPGPLQKAAAGAHHVRTSSVAASQQRSASPLGNGSVVLVPAKVETVECSIPIKVFPGNTPFRPTITVFDA
ncbi:hypothetical protein JCM10207_006497 [Rhodosporidiobolus poonsookiae]